MRASLEYARSPWCPQGGAHAPWDAQLGPLREGGATGATLSANCHGEVPQFGKADPPVGGVVCLFSALKFNSAGLHNVLTSPYFAPDGAVVGFAFQEPYMTLEKGTAAMSGSMVSERQRRSVQFGPDPGAACSAVMVGGGVVGSG